MAEEEKTPHLCNSCGRNKRRSLPLSSSPSLHSSSSSPSQQPPLVATSCLLPPKPQLRFSSCPNIPSSTARESKDDIIKKVQMRRWRRREQHAQARDTHPTPAVVGVDGDVGCEVEHRGPAIVGEKGRGGGDGVYKFVITCTCGGTHAVTVQRGGGMENNH